MSDAHGRGVDAAPSDRGRPEVPPVLYLPTTGRGDGRVSEVEIP